MYSLNFVETLAFMPYLEMKLQGPESASDAKRMKEIHQCWGSHRMFPGCKARFGAIRDTWDAQSTGNINEHQLHGLWRLNHKPMGLVLFDTCNPVSDLVWRNSTQGCQGTASDDGHDVVFHKPLMYQYKSQVPGIKSARSHIISYYHWNPHRFPLNPALCPLVGDQGFHSNHSQPGIVASEGWLGLSWDAVRMGPCETLQKLSITEWILITQQKSNPQFLYDENPMFISPITYHLLHSFALCFSYF